VGFVFASEVSALKAISKTNFELDSDSLQCLLTLRFVPSPRTLWKGVRRLPAGHTLSLNIETGDIQLDRYIIQPGLNFEGTRVDAVERYDDVLSQAVERQLLSDVPVGVSLSGGIDSALLAALAKSRGRALPCYTVGFGEKYQECEIEAAAETARLLDLPFTAVRVTPAGIMDTMEKTMAAVEEPIVSMSALAFWHLVPRMHDDVTVVLSGQGSDELWGGYLRYQNEFVRRLFLVRRLLHIVGQHSDFCRRIPEPIARALRSIPIDDEAQRFVQTYTLFTESQRNALTGRSDDGGASQDIEYWLNWCRRLDGDPVLDMMQIDSRTCLADDWLLYTDKVTMAFSLEARVPILDLRVTEFVESLPRRFRVALGRRKILHRMMARRYLPSVILKRAKKGFPIPFGEWSRGPIRARVQSMLLDVLPQKSPFRRQEVERLWEDHLAGRQPLDRQIYSLFVLGNWFSRGVR
jgi:asparagine synthase (glutamine-hydrolysing)